MLKEMNKVDMMDVNGGAVKIVLTVVRDLGIAGLLNEGVKIVAHVVTTVVAPAVNKASSSAFDAMGGNSDQSNVVHTRPIHDGMRP